MLLRGTKTFCEYALLPRLTQYFKQAYLQFGFTRGFSMLIAAFVISESRDESKFMTLKSLMNREFLTDFTHPFDFGGHACIKIFDDGRKTWMYPAMSPDLNPIERIWDMLCRHILAREHPLQSIRQLEAALHREWQQLSQQDIFNHNITKPVFAVKHVHFKY
jgi:hypothetical protein